MDEIIFPFKGEKIIEIAKTGIKPCFCAIIALYFEIMAERRFCRLKKPKDDNGDGINLMQRKIKLQNENILYQVRESRRARCLRITVYPGGELSATLPRNFSLEQLENFLRQKADWILRKINLARKRRPNILLPRSNRREYLKYKNLALELAKRKVEELNAAYNFHYRRISIRNQKMRWGSCSRKGNLNFNYKIIHLPEKYLDYIIVHELCHLQQFNHSKKFWSLVTETIPDYKIIRKEFRNL